VFLVPAALLSILVATFLVLVLLFAPFTQEVREQQAAEPSPAHDIAADQETNESAFLISAAFFPLALIVLFASLAKQVG
jgi:hypothetical protein